jgi:hypothetical protein
MGSRRIPAGTAGHHLSGGTMLDGHWTAGSGLGLGVIASIVLKIIKLISILSS